MKLGMAMGKEMTFAIERFQVLCKRVKEAKAAHGFADPELIRERNDAAAEAIALIKAAEEHLSGEWKERLHALHKRVEEKWRREEGGQRIQL